MNKWQLIVLGLMVLVLCTIVLNPPMTKGRKEEPSYFEQEMEIDTCQRIINWSKVAQRGIPILLIGGFLFLVLKKKKEE